MIDDIVIFREIGGVRVLIKHNVYTLQAFSLKSRTYKVASQPDPLAGASVRR